MATTLPNQPVKYFFRGLPLNEELVGMMTDIIADFYNIETSCFDYKACKKSTAYAQLQVLARSLYTFDPLTMETDQEKKAFWINLYNALILHLVIVEEVDTSILEVKDFFTSYQYQLYDLSLTLDQIEHGILRGNRPNYMKLRRPFSKRSPLMKHVLEADPRIHMALFCASVSCSALAAFSPGTVDQQLDQAVRKGLEKLVYIENNKIFLPKCFLWYKIDFNGKKGSLDFVARYHPNPDISRFIQDNQHTLRINYLPFDWGINHLD